jgi:hypothetical protein
LSKIDSIAGISTPEMAQLRDEDRRPATTPCSYRGANDALPTRQDFDMAGFRIAVVAVGALIASLATSTYAFAAPSAGAHAVPHSGSITFVIGGATKHPIALAHGAISAAGKDDPNHNNYDVLKFAHGSMRIVHPASKAKYVPTIDEKTCYATFTETGKFTISHGTGSYAGIKGSGHYKAQGYAYLPRTKSGACNENVEPTHEIFTVQAKGKLK